MASARALMKKMDLSTGMVGVGAVALDTAVGFGASYAMGQVYHRYNGKWWGKQAPRIAAIVGKIGAVGLAAIGHGASVPTGILNSVGQAGVNAIGLEMGLRHAREKTGKKAVLVPKTTPISAIKDAVEMPSIGHRGRVSSMGALGTAPQGRGLTWNQVEELAAGR